MAELPDRARIVIVGGGVGGASVAYHLARRGETDVLLVERAELTSGSTFHSAGLVGPAARRPGVDPHERALGRARTASCRERARSGWVESGSLRLASSPERLVEIRRQHGWAQRAGLPLELISADEARDLFPLMTTDGVLGAAYTPTDGQIDPARLCTALAAGRPGGRGADRAAHPGRRVRHGRRPARAAGGRGAHRPGRRRVRGRRRLRRDVRRRDRGAGGRPDPGGADVAPVPRDRARCRGTLPARLPSLRDPDLLVYYRQEIDGLVMGGYERQSAPAWPGARAARGLQRQAARARLGPVRRDPRERGQVRVPVLADVGIASTINGPEGFTPDNEFCLGETEVAGFFVAAGFCAHGIAGAGGIGDVMANWVLDGDPGLDLWHMDVRRFGRHYRSPGYTLARVRENYESYYDIRYPGAERAAGRPLRTSPAYAWHAAHGASFGEKSGWERVNHYATPGDEALRPRGWAGRHWSPCVEPEHRAARETAALFDETSFAKIEISGPDAAAFCLRVFAGQVGRPPGAVVYTQALERAWRHRDGRDRVAAGRRRVPRRHGHGVRVARHRLAAPSGPADRRRRADRRRDERVGVFRAVGAAGAGAVGAAHARVAGQRRLPVPVVAGDDGRRTCRCGRCASPTSASWGGSCTARPSTARRCGRRWWRTGATPAGYRAIESLRLEKGYRAWGSDIGPETTPAEAGLGFAVRRGAASSGPDGVAGAGAAAAVPDPGRSAGGRAGR